MCAILAQQGDSLPISIGTVGSVVYILHQVPLKGSVGQFGHYKALRLGRVFRNRQLGRLGPFVVVHQLSHGNGGTTHLGLPDDGVAVGSSVHELQVMVEWLTLSPDARGQRSNGCAFDELGGVAGRGGHAFGIVVEQLLHGGGHIVGIKCARVAIAQDGGHQVVAGDNHIALTRLGIEHIVGALAGGGQTAMKLHGL